MEPRKGFYSLIQYCPDRSRMEAANVGVVLCIPESRYIIYRISTSNQRVRRFFRPEHEVDPAWMNHVKDSISTTIERNREDLATIEGWTRFAATRANELTVTPPTPAKVYDPETEIEALYERLVGTRKSEQKEATSGKHALVRELEEAFRSPTLRERIQFDQQVEIPIIGQRTSYTYAFQNGVMNYIDTPRLGDNFLKSVEKRAIEGNLIHTRTDNKVIVVPEISPSTSNKERVREITRNLFSAFEIRTVWEDERMGFIEEVMKSAH